MHHKQDRQRLSEGKLGLALSGGGFRASFFHIGLLARLADADLLRHVEVLSTVSGGSIVGAFYYVKLKQLLEQKQDADITADDYRQLIGELIDEFSAAVSRNPRLLTFSNPIKNLRTRRPNYSRTDRMGELLDDLFYRPLFGENRREPVLMRELKVRPKGDRKDFHPESHNAGRSAKVPILLINATTLNTGRNWRFEAIRMGEPPPIGSREKDLDTIMRLERPERYYMTPIDRQQIPLGHAVAASAAVPGLFTPLSISHLYDGTRVELVDGGVHDNQGIQGLLDRGCSQLIVSDGSSQMEGDANPSTVFYHVLMRTQSILMSRLRQEQILAADCRPGVEALSFTHLRKGLAPEVVPYLDRSGQPKTSADKNVESKESGMDRYGIHPRVQQCLARLRTDLDAFHESERYALMQSGYAISGDDLATERAIWARRGKKRKGDWVFQKVQWLMQEPTEEFLRVLRISGSTLFKVFMIYPLLGTVTGITLAGLVAALLWYYQDFFRAPIQVPPFVPSRFMVMVTLGLIGTVAYGPIRSLLLNLRWIKAIARYVREPLRWLLRLFTRGLPSAIGSLFIAIYLVTLNKWYLRGGSLDRLSRRKTPGSFFFSKRAKRVPPPPPM